MQLDVEPGGPIEAIGDALGLVQRQAIGDLASFKEFIEARGEETGAWRVRSLGATSAATAADMRLQGPGAGSLAAPSRAGRTLASVDDVGSGVTSGTTTEFPAWTRL